MQLESWYAIQPGTLPQGFELYQMKKPLVKCTAPTSVLVEQKSEMCYRYHEVYQNLAMGFLNTLNWINVFDRFSIYNDQHDNNDADINSLTLFK